MQQRRILSISLDAEYAQRLRRLAEQWDVEEPVLAGLLLARAIDDVDVDPRTVVELLNGIPGARDRIMRARQQIARDEGIPLDNL